jgi:hypothetical protein
MPVRDAFLVVAEKTDAHLLLIEAKLKEHQEEVQQGTDTNELNAIQKVLNSLSHRVSGGVYKDFLVRAELTKLRVERANVTGPAQTNSSENA